jgi:hypothetical protein
VEYLVHLGAAKELEASEAYPPGGIYYAVDGEKVATIAKRFGVSALHPTPLTLDPQPCTVDPQPSTLTSQP